MMHKRKGVAISVPNKIAKRRLCALFGGVDVLKNMPINLLRDLTSWDEIYLSPVSWSFYNKPKTKEFTLDQTKRLSNHWNFMTKDGKIQCRTNTIVENDTNWSLGVYNKKTRTYNNLKSYPLTNRDYEDWKELKKEIFDKYKEESKRYSIELQEKINQNKILIDFEFNDVKYCGKLTKLNKHSFEIDNQIMIEQKNFNVSVWKEVKLRLYETIQEI